MKITGKRIMEVLGEKTITNFIRRVLEPVFGSYCRLLIKDSSKLMNGKDTYSHSTFDEWADTLRKNPQKYKELLQKIKYYELNNDKTIRSFRKMFEEDRAEMQTHKGLAEKIERKFENKEISEAIVLMLLWALYRKDIGMLSFLYSDGESEKPKEPTENEKVRLLPHHISANPIYIKHDSLLLDIRDKLLQPAHFVFLQGMGGIGKTESAKQYVKRFLNFYDSIVFAECSSTLTELLNDNTIFTLTAPFVSERLLNASGMPETDDEYYRRKLAALRYSVNERTLIILDNVDTEDRKLSDFLTGICHVIVTTRWRSQDVYPDETLILDEIYSTEECKEIFSKYYGKDVSDDPFVSKLITYFSNHILALELIAKQMCVSGLSAEEMWNIIQSQNESELEEGFLLPNKDCREQSIATHIQQIFNITNLTETERYILSCLSLMPKSGLERKYVRDFCGLKNYKELNSLIKRSWLRRVGWYDYNAYAYQGNYADCLQADAEKLFLICAANDEGTIY